MYFAARLELSYLVFFHVPPRLICLPFLFHYHVILRFRRHTGHRITNYSAWDDYSFLYYSYNLNIKIPLCIVFRDSCVVVTFSNEMILTVFLDSIDPHYFMHSDTLSPSFFLIRYLCISYGSFTMSLNIMAPDVSWLCWSHRCFLLLLHWCKKWTFMPEIFLIQADSMAR